MDRSRNYVCTVFVRKGKRDEKKTNSRSAGNASGK